MYLACIRMYSRYSHVSNGPKLACAESACIVMYRACPNWGAGIHRYRKVSPVSCIEYVSRGPRFTHFFKTCEIREIHARYQGKKMEEYRIIIPVKKRAIHYDTWYWGKTDPIFGGNRAPIRSEDPMPRGRSDARRPQLSGAKATILRPWGALTNASREATSVNILGALAAAATQRM